MFFMLVVMVSAQCFSTGVPRRVLPKASKDSAELNREMETKRHLRDFAATIDEFSRLVVRPKCICGRGSAPNPAKGAYTAPPDPPVTSLPTLGPETKFLAMPMGSVSNWNCCKGFRFKEKVENTVLAAGRNCDFQLLSFNFVVSVLTIQFLFFLLFSLEQPQGCSNREVLGSNDPPPGNLHGILTPRSFGKKYFLVHRSVDSQQNR